MDSLHLQIERCLIPKLTRNVEERNDHPEFDVRNKYLDNGMQVILKYLGETNLKNNENIISLLLILYKELNNDCLWNNEKCKQFANKLNFSFELLSGLNLDKILEINNVFDNQHIFEHCLAYLHGKLTSDDFKKYPGQIEVYCNLMFNIKKYGIEIIPQKTFPASLLLMDDYIKENKIQGLQCCIYILQCLDNKHFEHGNYYEVIYMSIKKMSLEKDITVTKLAHECFLALYHILPSNEQVIKIDDSYAVILDQLNCESNLYRKAACLNFTKKIISIHKINCATRSIFKSIITDNLDICCNDAVAEVILKDLLLAFQEWLKYCWCVWNFPTDFKIIYNLFKILYTCKDEYLITEVEKSIITLIILCSKIEQTEIVNNLENIPVTTKDSFLKRINSIKSDLSI